MATGGNEPNVPELAYAPPPRFAWAARVARWRWRLVLLAAAVAVGVPAYRHRQSLAERARWLYWSRACATHVMPGPIELVVSDPQRAADLIASDPDYVARRPVRGAVFATTQPGPVALYVPRAWRMLWQVDGRTSWLGTPFGDEPITFLGERRRPDGETRLVVVQGSDTNAYQLLDQTRVLVLPRPGLFDPVPKRVGSGGMWLNGIWRPAALRGGIADPNDPTHITFEFVVYRYHEWTEIEATGTIDAYLQNDDSLRFELRADPELDRLRVRLPYPRRSGVIPQRAIDGWKF